MKNRPSKHLLSLFIGFLFLCLPHQTTNTQLESIDKVLNSIEKEFDLGPFLQMLELFYKDSEKNSEDLAVMEKNRIRINPYLTILDDTAVIPYYLHLYTKVRMEEIEPYVNIEFILTSHGNGWNV